MKNVVFFVVFFLLIKFNSTAQNFKYEAITDSTHETGFHKILITPEITSKLKSDFSDIRIFDEKDMEIPYLKRTEIPISNTELFREYRIVSSIIDKGCCSKLIIENIDKKKINNISLLINNSDVKKELKLSGSDDQKNWYVIKDDFVFQSVYSITETSEIKLMNFPLSDYAYFKIEINDSASAPLKIVKAGYYDTESEIGKYSEIPVKKMTQFINENDKRTYVRVVLNSDHYIDKMEISVSGPTYYLRSASISRRTDDSYAVWDKNSTYESIKNIELVSNDPNTVHFSKMKLSEFFILIENEDNQPLQIKSLKVYQLNNYLTAYLDKSKRYTLKFGNKNSIEPVYDIGYFENKIPENIPVLRLGDITSNVKNEQNTKVHWLSNKLILWIIIGFVIIFLGTLSVKMIKEMK